MEDTAGTGPDVARAEAAPAPHELHVLMVEDSPEDAELNAVELSDAGLRFVSRRVQTRDDFLRALDEFHPDIILSDHRLPAFDGREALRLARAHCPDVPVIMVTGALGDEVAVELLRAGARDYVLKDRLARLPSAVLRALAEEQDGLRRKEAELALRESEALHRSLIAASPDGVAVVDAHERVIFASPRLHELLGLDAGADLRGLELLAWTAPEDREPTRAHLTRVARGETVTDVECRLVRADGTPLHVEMSAAPIVDAHDTLRGIVTVWRDASARRQALEALRDSEERYRSVVTTMAEGVVLRSADGLVRACNASAERILGLTAEQMADGTPLDARWRAIHDDGRPFADDEHPATVTLRTGQPCSGVVMGVHKADGGLTWISINTQPVTRPGADRPHAVVTSFSDITARRLAEQALRRSHAWLAGQRALLERIARGEPLREVLRHFALLLDELMPGTQSWFLLLEPGSELLKLVAAPSLPASYAAAFGGVLACEGQGACATAAARRSPVIVTDMVDDALCATCRCHGLAVGLRASWSFPLLTGKGEPVGVLATHSRTPRGPSADERRIIEGAASIAALAIERARTEDAIRGAAAEWVATFDALEAAVLILDEADRIARLNGTAADLLGSSSGACLGRALASLGDDEPWREVRRAVAEVRAARHVELSRVRDGRGLSWEIDVTPSVADAGGAGRVIVTLRDVTRLARLQESMVRAERMAAMGALVAGVAHEVRNPLFAMSVNIDALSVVLQEHDQVRELIGAVCQERDRISALMEDLLSYGRSSASKRVRASLEPVLAAAVRGCATQAERAGVTLEREGSAQGAELIMDAHRLEEVFDNLLENAYQNTPRGGRVVLSVEHLEDADGARLSVAVRDQGTGFTPEALERAFEPFFTQRRGGTGLGLAIVQRIVEEHEGSVTLANAPEGGGVVTVELPLAPPE